MGAVTARVSTRLANREYSTNEQSFTIEPGSDRTKVEETLALAKLVADVADATFGPLDLPSDEPSEQQAGEIKLLRQHCAKLQEENQRKTLMLSAAKSALGEAAWTTLASAVEGSGDWLSVGSHSKID